jgi:Papain family cysteine protease
MTGRKTSDGYLVNAVPDEPDRRDLAYRPALIKLAPAMMPRIDRVEILDQKAEGACTGFGLAAVINRLHKMRGQDTRVSPRMLYEMARKFDEWPGEAYSGSSCRGAIQGWHAMGVCTEGEWPYKPGKPGALTVTRAKLARRNTIGAYYRVAPRVSDFHAAINETHCLYVSANVHKGWEKGAVKNGVIPFKPGSIGGHAFAIIGYDARGFLVQNSWGPGWGRGGLAVWTYEDWQANISDAWVLRLALPTPQIWHDSPGRGAGGAPGQEGLFGESAPPRTRIAGHFVHIDDGLYQDHGRYFSNGADVRLTARLVGDSDDYDHLLLYAHGGLNSPEDSARRIAAMRDTFKANRIYPFHFMYDTGLMEELKDVVLDRREGLEERMGGFTDWMDQNLERWTRRIGRGLWREMKRDAQKCFVPKLQTGTPGAALDTARAFADALKRDDARKKQVHLVGHSTGAILLAHLVDTLAKANIPLSIKSCSLMAPAATVALFESHYRPSLSKLGDVTIYRLSDRLELDDNVAEIYRKSLLYLVSNSYEENPVPAPILGMQTFAGRVPTAKNLHVEVSTGPGGNTKTQSTSHGGFDNDPATMNDILVRILGAKPKVPFTEGNLKY